MEDERLVPSGDSPGEEDVDMEEVKSPPPAPIRRFRTLPPELDLSIENGGRDHRGDSFVNSLRHHHSDESDYRPCGGRDDRAGGSRYTSLRDILASPSAPSPTAATAWPHDGEISIRNRLVKHAAYAYLQPMSAKSPGYAPERAFQWRLGCETDGCLGFLEERLVPEVLQALNSFFERFQRMFAVHRR